MKQQAWIPALVFALCGTAQAQSNEELEAKLDEALRPHPPSLTSVCDRATLEWPAEAGRPKISDLFNR